MLEDPRTMEKDEKKKAALRPRRLVAINSGLVLDWLNERWGIVVRGGAEDRRGR